MKPKEGRKHVVLLEEPVCTREVFAKTPLASGSVKVRLDFTTYKAKESMRKCPSSTRNQERIFIAGDTVSIPNIYRGRLQDLDSTTPLWFLVQKARTRSSVGSNTNATKGTKAQLWKRCWGELARFLEHSTAEKVTKSFEASEVGMVKPSPKRVNSAREALVSPSLSALLITCYLVNLCPTGRCESASELWIQREFFTEYEGKCENNDGNDNNTDNVSGNSTNGNSNGGDKQCVVSCQCDNQQRNETFYNNSNSSNSNSNKMVYRKKKTHVVRDETEHIKTVIVQHNTLPSIEASPLIYSSSGTQNNITNSIKSVINNNNVNANTNNGNDVNSTELSQQSLPSFAPQQSPPERVSYLPPPPSQHVLTQAMTVNTPSQSLTVPPNLYYSHPHNNNSNSTFNNNNNIFDNNNNNFDNNSFNNCSIDDRKCFGIGQRSDDDDDDGSGFPDYFDSFDQDSFAENHFYGMDYMLPDFASSYSSSESESSDLSSTFSSVPAAVDINPSSYSYESSVCDCCCGSGCVNDDDGGDNTFHFCDAHHLNC